MRFLDRLLNRPASDPLAMTPMAGFTPAPPSDFVPFTDAGPSEQFTSVAHGIVPLYQQGRPVYPRRDVGTYEEQGYAKLALGFACVGIVADVGSAVPLRVYDEQADGTTPTVPNHPMAALMRRPNPEMWFGEFIWTILMTAAVAGFCVIEKVRSKVGRPVELWPLDPTRLRAVLRNQAPPDWEYRIAGRQTPILIPAENAMVYRWRNRLNRSPYGIGPFETLFREIGLQNIMTDFLKAFFDGGALPQQMVMIDTLPGQQLSQEQKDALRDAFMRRFGGLSNAWEPIFGGSIKDVKQIGFDFEQLAWEKLRDLNDLAVCQAFGVPASMAQIRVGLEHATNRANVEADELRLYRQVIIPQLSRLDGVLTLGLLSEFPTSGRNESLEFDYSGVSALKEDQTKELEQFRGMGREGHATVNDVRRKANLPELPSEIGDVLYVPLFVSPKSAITGEAFPAVSPVAAPTTPATDDDTAQLGAGTVRELAASTGPSSRMAAIGEANRTAHQQIAAARTPSVGAFFTAQGNRVVGATTLRAGSGPAHRMVAVAVDWDDEDRLLSEVVRRIHLLAGQTSWANTAEQLGVELAWDLANPRVRDVMDQLALRVTGINDTSRTLVQEAVTKAAENGTSLEDLKAQLQKLFTSWADWRAESVARTESMMSYGLASTAAYRESGVVTQIQCFDNAGHKDTYGAKDGLSCAERDGLIDSLDSAELHLESEHVNGSLAIAPVIGGE